MAQSCTLPLPGAKQPPLLPREEPAFPVDKVVPSGHIKKGVLPPRQTKASPSDTCVFLLQSLESWSGWVKSITKLCGEKLCCGETHTSPSVSECLSSLPWGNAFTRPCWKRLSLGRGQRLGGKAVSRLSSPCTAPRSLSSPA